VRECLRRAMGSRNAAAETPTSQRCACSGDAAMTRARTTGYAISWRASLNDKLPPGLARPPVVVEPAR
jgi:hypothetical protein